MLQQQWTVPARAGPQTADGKAVMWAYHSHRDEVILLNFDDHIIQQIGLRYNCYYLYYRIRCTGSHSVHVLLYSNTHACQYTVSHCCTCTKQIRDTYAGLEGVIIVYKPGMLNDQNLATDATEFVLLLKVNNENKSWFLEDNCNKHGISPEHCSPDDPEFEESNLMHAINGRFYGNLDGLTMKVGKPVRWFLAAFGTEVSTCYTQRDTSSYCQTTSSTLLTPAYTQHADGYTLTGYLVLLYLLRCTLPGGSALSSLPRQLSDIR
jgi:hypothetical protein